MVRISESTILDAPAHQVWALLRDFNAHDRWHPAIAKSRIEDDLPTGIVGAVRAFALADGGRLREQLIALSDREWTLTYCLLNAPVPLDGYVAQMRLRPVTNGDRTLLEWRSEFHPPRARRVELEALVRDGIYRAGFAALSAWFGGAAPRDVAPPQPIEAAPVRGAPSPATVPASEAAQATAIVVERHGGPEVLTPRRIALPAVGPGEVRLQQTAIGVNFIDLYCRTGYFDLLTPPGVPGMEAAGVIEAVGLGVAAFAPGDRVAYACPPVGAYATHRVMATDFLVPLPDRLTDEVAAAGLLKGISASFLLHEVHPLQPGETVLVHAAAGGIGQLLVQWARMLGARVIATVSTAEKAAVVRDLGADTVIQYADEDFVAAVNELTDGQGADVVFDAVGLTTFAGSVAAAAIRGHVVSFGQASGPVGMWDIGSLSEKSLRISRPNYAHYTATPQMMRRHADRFLERLSSGALRLHRIARYPLTEAARAHVDLERRRTMGSLILTP